MIKEFNSLEGILDRDRLKLGNNILEPMIAGIESSGKIKNFYLREYVVSHRSDNISSINAHIYVCSKIFSFLDVFSTPVFNLDIVLYGYGNYSTIFRGSRSCNSINYTDCNITLSKNFHPRFKDFFKYFNPKAYALKTRIKNEFSVSRMNFEYSHPI